MLTLSAATSEVKSIFKWGGITIGTFTILFLTIRLINNIIQSKKPPPPPTVSFGKLPAISFPQSFVTRPTTYTIDTITGQLPATGNFPGQFPDRVAVYTIVKNAPNLLAVQTATERVKGIDPPFASVDSPTALSQTQYQWADTNRPYRKLTMDIITYNFSLSSSFLNDPDVLSGNNAPDEPAAIQTAQAFLSSLFGGLPNDLEPSLTKTQLLMIQNGILVPATSLSASQVIQVNFFQKAVDNFPLYYPQGNGSPMQFLVAGGSPKQEVVDAHFTYQAVGKDSATYPIKTAAEAYAELQNGNGFIALNSGNKDGILIRQVSLGYYIGDETQSYLMPVVVFSGDGFLAYIPAITDQWTQK